MATAKDVRIAPIKASDAAALIRRVHYSGKVVNNSQLHLGAFLDGRLEGAMSFGPSLDKRKMQGLVRDTPWNGFLELNRMAFSERLPRNSESRAIGVAFRMIRKAYPHIQWVVSFSDATQCGDGTIYRASGFLLTGIKANNQIIEFPDGRRETRFVLTGGAPAKAREIAALYGARMGGGSTLKPFLDIGAKALPGFQLRYMAFLDPTALDRLTVPVLPFGKIEELGAGMYLGHQISRVKQAIDGDQPNSGGATPTHTLQSQDDPA
jgi:hypothetical protein